MHIDLKDPLTLILAIAAFGFVCAIWFGGLLIWHVQRSVRGRRVEQRLGIGSPEPAEQAQRVLRLWHDGTEVTTVVPGALPTVMQRLERLRADAGLITPVRTVVIGLLGLSAMSFALGVSLSGSSLIGIGAAVVALQVVWILLNSRISKRHVAFERQFVDSLALASRSLRVGHPLVGAFQLISEEVAAPVGTIFSEIVQQQALGMSLDQAIRRAAEECPSPDFKFFATSVVIQIRSGGNLADMMDRLATVLRDRIRLSRRVRVLTAQTQLSKRILLALPIITLVALDLINPEYMAVLWNTPAGHMVLATAGGGLLIGGWLMNVLATQRT